MKLRIPGYRALCLASSVALMVAATSRAASAQPLSCTVTQVTSAVEFSFSGASISADGARIAFRSPSDPTGANPGGMQIFLYDVASHTFTQVTFVSGGNKFSPVLSAEGNRLAFQSDRDLTGGNADTNLEIFLYDAATDSLAQVTDTTGSDLIPLVNSSPSINANGTRIAFQSNRDITGQNADGNLEIFLYDAISQGFTQVTHTTGGGGAFGNFLSNSHPAIDGDGTRVAFQSDLDLTGDNPDGNFEIFLYDATAGITQITFTTDGFHTDPSIDGSGTRIAFRSNGDLAGTGNGNVQIFLSDTDAGTVTQITDSPSASGTFNPSLNSAGTHIAFHSDGDHAGNNPDEDTEIFLYEIGTNNYTQITDSTHAGVDLFTATAATVDDAGRHIAFGDPRDLTGGNADAGWEVFLGTCTEKPDSDGDGIPDDSDPDTVADVVIDLPLEAFHSGGNQNAFLSRLEQIQQLILAGQLDAAVLELNNLRKRVDGCGAAADNNDWITDCAAQVQVRNLIDILITNLSN